MSFMVRQALECAFWGSAAVIAYTYVAYPVLMYVRSRLRPRLWRQAPTRPNVSIIMAVHNGATVLRQKIEHLLSLDYPQERIDLIVISDGSTDETVRILQDYRHPRLKVIVREEHRGKAAALNAGISRATGDLLLFVDIRPWLEGDALGMLVSNFADPQVGCAAGELVLRGAGHDPGSKAVGGLYWRYEQWIRSCEAKVDSPLGVYGGFYAVRRELAKALPEGLILDDMFQPLNVIRQGYRSVLDERARVYDIWPQTSREEFSRKVRTLAGNFQLLQVAPWLLSDQNYLRFELISHKLLRLIVPLLLAVTFFSSAWLVGSSPFFTAILLLQLGFYFLAVISPAPRFVGLEQIAGAAKGFCILNAAVVVGFQKFLFTRGPLWKIWLAAPATNQQRTIR